MIDSGETYPPDRPRRRFRERLHPGAFVQKHHFRITLFFLIASFFMVLFWHTIVVPVPAGHEGVYWSRFFGGTRDSRLTEGTHLKFPWDGIAIYDVRVLVAQQATHVLTTDGMTIAVEYVAQFRADQANLPTLHRILGPEYAEKIVKPVVVSSLRQILGNYRADEIYARDEQSLLTQVDSHVRQSLGTYPIQLQSVLLLRLELPQLMSEGIVDKLLQEQRVLAYTFRLRAEEQERQRKQIEAEGIRVFEETSGISMLTWRGLDVTSELAKSPNAKIVIMGTGADGLPVILNADR